MIFPLSQEKQGEALRYIGDERGKCLYMYMDICKFGMNTSEISVWMQKRTDVITALMMQYHNGFHIYSRDDNFIIGEIVDLIENQMPTMICGTKRTIEDLAPGLPNYAIEYGEVSKLESATTYEIDVNVGLARHDDFRQIGKMLKDDEGYGAAFTFEELESQFRGRQESGLSRSYVYKRHGDVLAHVATGAESIDIATISGVIVNRMHRRKGLALKVMSAICSDLQSEGKSVYSIYYAPQSASLHQKVGFVKYCDWGKLYKRVCPST